MLPWDFPEVLNLRVIFLVSYYTQFWGPYKGWKGIQFCNGWNAEVTVKFNEINKKGKKKKTKYNLFLLIPSLGIRYKATSWYSATWKAEVDKAMLEKTENIWWLSG